MPVGFGQIFFKKKTTTKFSSNKYVLGFVFMHYLIVPRRNEVAEGGYWITLRPSVRPLVRHFASNNFKTFGRILMISQTGL